MIDIILHQTTFIRIDGIEMNFDAVEELWNRNIRTKYRNTATRGSFDSINEHLIQSKQILSNRLF